MGGLINLLSSVHILCCTHQQSAAKVAAVSTVTFQQSSVIAASVVSLKVVETACSEIILDVNSCFLLLLLSLLFQTCLYVFIKTLNISFVWLVRRVHHYFCTLIGSKSHHAKAPQRNRLYVCIYFHQNTILIIVAVVFILFEKIMTRETVL